MLNVYDIGVRFNTLLCQEETPRSSSPLYRAQMSFHAGQKCRNAGMRTDIPLTVFRSRRTPGGCQRDRRACASYERPLDRIVTWNRTRRLGRVPRPPAETSSHRLLRGPYLHTCAEPTSARRVERRLELLASGMGSDGRECGSGGATGRRIGACTTKSVSTRWGCPYTAS